MTCFAPAPRCSRRLCCLRGIAARAGAGRPARRCSTRSAPAASSETGSGGRRRSPRPATRASCRRSKRSRDGDLYVRKADGAVVIGRKAAGRTLALTDPLTGETARRGAQPRAREDQGQQPAAPRHPQPRSAALTLLEPRPGVRLRRGGDDRRSAATRKRSTLLDAALAQETDAGVRAAHGAGARRGAPRLRPAGGREGRRHRRDRRARRPRRAGASSRRCLSLRGRADPQGRRGRASPRSRARSRCGRRRRTSGTASRSARCCCSPPSASPSPSA